MLIRLALGFIWRFPPLPQRLHDILLYVVCSIALYTHRWLFFLCLRSIQVLFKSERRRLHIPLLLYSDKEIQFSIRPKQNASNSYSHLVRSHHFCRYICHSLRFVVHFGYLCVCVCASECVTALILQQMFFLWLLLLRCIYKYFVVLKSHKISALRRRRHRQQERSVPSVQEIIKKDVVIKSQIACSLESKWA